LRLLDYGLEWLELVCIIYYINENCIFKEFVDFEDCCFDGDVVLVLENVKFVKGTNLLGNKDTPVEVSFEKNLVLVNI
jgi:hypothetical protein